MAKTIQEPRVARHSYRRLPPPPRRPSLGARLLVGLLAFSSIFVAIGAAYGMGLYKIAEHSGDTTEIPSLKAVCVHGCNYLVLGSDSRVGLSASQKSMFGDETTVGGHRSDTIMLVHVDPEREKTVVLSFPRDLWVDIPHMGWDKITAAYAGGPNRVVKTIEQLTGLSINHFLAVNLAGFQKIVDALGGVELYVDRPMHDELAGLNIDKPGFYHFDGFQALAFVRARHVEGDCVPDFSRIGRQQQFLRAVLSKALSTGQIVHAASLVPAVFGSLIRDKGLKPIDVIALANELKNIDNNGVDFRAVPGTPQTIESTGQSVVIMDPDARELFRKIKNGNPHLGKTGLVLNGAPPPTANIRIRVFDDHSSGKAQRVYDLLSRAGFDIQTLKPSRHMPVGGAALFYKASTADMAKVVHGFLPTLGEHQVKDDVLPEVDVAVVIPSTYHGPPIAPPPPTGSTDGGTSAGC